jgi:hypothetical protein
MTGFEAGLDGRSRPVTGSAYGPAFSGLPGTQRNEVRNVGGDAFDPAVIVVDPQLPPAAGRQLTQHGLPAGDGTGTVLAELVPFRDPSPDVPPPPRSPRTAAKLAVAGWVLVALAITLGIMGNAAAAAISFAASVACGGLAVWASAAAKEGRLAIAGGLIPLPPARDLSAYYTAHAGRLFHRRYVRPRSDLDPDAQATWHRAVSAANRIYRSESLRDKAVDADRVAADVPELLWRIAEGLAMISDVRIHIENIVRDMEAQHPAVRAKLKEVERQLARGTSQVDRRIGRLEMLAERLDAADAARQGETALKRLIEVDTKIHDLVATTGETATDVEAATGLQIDVEAVIALTNQAIWELSGQDEDAESG